MGVSLSLCFAAIACSGDDGTMEMAATIAGQGGAAALGSGGVGGIALAGTGAGVGGVGGVAGIAMPSGGASGAAGGVGGAAGSSGGSSGGGSGANSMTVAGRRPAALAHRMANPAKAIVTSRRFRARTDRGPGGSSRDVQI